MDSSKGSGKKTKKRQKKQSIDSLNSSYKGRSRENKDDKDQIEQVEELFRPTEFPPKLSVLLDTKHPGSKSIKTHYAAFLHPSVLRAYKSSPHYFYIKGEQTSSLCIAYPLKTVKKWTIVLPRDTMGFVHEESVTLYPYQGLVHNASTVTVAFDNKVTMNEKQMKERVLDVLVHKKFFYSGMKLKCLSLDHSEFTITSISRTEPQYCDDQDKDVSKSILEGTKDSTSKKLDQSLSDLSLGISAMSLKHNESHVSQDSKYLDQSYRFDEEIFLKADIPTYFTVYSGTQIVIQLHLDDTTSCMVSTSCYAHIGGLEQELQDMKAAIDAYFSPEYQFFHETSGVIFLYGPPGTGKSSILQAVHEVYDVHIEEILWYDVYAKELPDSVNELRQIFKRAQSRAPSIILIDDFNYFVPFDDSQDKISTILLQEIENCIGMQIIIVAAAKDSRCKEALESFRVKEIELRLPDYNQREDIITKLLKDKKHDLSLEEIEQFASCSGGFTGKDLKDTLEAGMHHFLKEKNSISTEILGENSITFSDIMRALNRKRPLVTNSEVRIKKVKWEDIGGMASVKKKLKDIVEGPLKNPEIYERYDMKPARGVLLYGPPGCSKTMIAKALATECDLNFISKNVSDIHNKYVGESEKAVSDLFIMARSKAPCIVFLDEIDALMPSRGCSTGSGVEERVANIFLQELDGIEELNNVLIVAATNRPDRIDEAFLRYGRISHYIYIPLPDIEAREEILKLQMRKRTVSTDFDYRHLALKTEGYSGAEIVNLCNDAAFQLLNEMMDCDWPIFTMKHFEKALQTILPRTNKELLEFYDDFNLKYC